MGRQVWGLRCNKGSVPSDPGSWRSRLQSEDMHLPPPPTHRGLLSSDPRSSQLVRANRGDQTLVHFVADAAGRAILASCRQVELAGWRNAEIWARVASTDPWTPWLVLILPATPSLPQTGGVHTRAPRPSRRTLSRLTLRFPPSSLPSLPGPAGSTISSPTAHTAYPAPSSRTPTPPDSAAA